jgi:hypothetical protein
MREPSAMNGASLDRRRFLRSTATGAGSVALWAGVGVAPDAAMAAATPAPAWAPASAGDARAVATTNTFLSQNGMLAGWESAFGKIIDDYSGGVFNPYWGPLGAMVFHGGGHAATFDNSVVILDLNDLTFKRLSNPTPSNKGANWVAISAQSKNGDPAFNGLYCEYGDGQPGAAHTYDTLAILPPADGGAPCGSLIRVASFAVHVNLSRNTGWAHRFDFSSTAMRQGRWVRWSVNGPTNYLFPGACSAYDSRRKRFWWMAGLSSNPPMLRYIDVATQQQVDVRYAATARAAPAADSSSMTLRYDPVRDILVLTCTMAGKLVLAFLRCASPATGWVVPPLSANIPARPGATHPFDGVPEADKWVLLTGADRSALYDLHARQDPAREWTVTRRPLVGMSMPTARIAGKRWSYAPAVKSFVWMASSSSGVMAYRPFL